MKLEEILGQQGVLGNAMNMQADTSGMTQAQVDDGIAKSRHDLLSQFAAMPAGLVEGALGIGGDVELLGQGIKGAYNAEEGQTLDGFLAGLQDRDTFFPNTMDVQEGTDKLLDGTAYGDMLKAGGDGRLLGEFVAPLPTIPGLAKAGKFVGLEGAKQLADTVGTGIKAERTPGLSGGIGQLLGMSQDPAMVIGQQSKLWDAKAADKFYKAIKDEPILANRLKNNEFKASPLEQKLWEETAKSGNPTFLDIDNVIKQEVPTGDINLTQPLTTKAKPGIFKNKSLESYKNIKDDMSIGTLPKTGVYKDYQGLATHNYNPKTDAIHTEILTNKKVKGADLQENLAHEGQHAIQRQEGHWATGSTPEIFKPKFANNITRSWTAEQPKVMDWFNKLVEKGETFADGTPIQKTKEDFYNVLDSGAPEVARMKEQSDAINYLKEYDLKMYPDKHPFAMRHDPTGDSMYYRDAGELLPHVTQDRIKLTKDDIAKDHILNQYDRQRRYMENEGFAGELPITPRDVVPVSPMEAYKTGVNPNGNLGKNVDNRVRVEELFSNEELVRRSKNKRPLEQSTIDRLKQATKGRRMGLI